MIVRDKANGRVGELMAVIDYVDGSQPTHLPRVPVRLAFIRPLGGGTEWDTNPDNLIMAYEPWEETA
ncbi:hypothetical protein [Streptomyces violaceusniger]|uniref:hypothetical protein n=1 Tax=Streptomyces violaceusniger TaxID=68280 RepID=UPI0012E07BCC|nr:hypothetical protein [Streptomyces violaceusniger]